MSLLIRNLHTSIGGKKILNGIFLEIRPGEVHALMGPNGSGKSTLANVLMGHPDYEILKIKNQKSKISVDEIDITGMEADERARSGLFLAFQHPVSIPGVSVVNFLRAAYKNLHEKEDQPSTLEFFNHLKSLAKKLQLDEELLKRSLNEGLSGGERKKMEALQMLALKPKYIILDEFDTGTDVDALRILGQVINGEVRKQMTEGGNLKVEGRKGKTKIRKNERTNLPGVLLITHYNRIFKYIKPDVVHILKEGKIVKSGGFELVEKVEKEGYGEFGD
jgi:Fe-S cluster assembly ATP-binding protein